LAVTAHHVDHRLRPESGLEAERAAAIADTLGVPFVLHVATIGDGPNLEARARDARNGLLPSGSMTGHTLDDQAETVLLRLLRGSGGDGLSAITPGHRHPILALRRAETVALCAELGLEPVGDSSNSSAAIRRNRVRHELLPLAAEIARRDIAPILARTADLLRDESSLLDALAAGIDATDARAVAEADVALARRTLRRWLTIDGYPPDSASIERVLAVARGESNACELSDGRRVERSRQRFRIVDPGQ
jgi:tRNA(Ile)-lysidine synthase